jgi:prepilin-type N-terminal cleavage/methylation domain-containing protein
MYKKQLGGFTFVELLVVMAIIGLLATIILASLNITREKARVNKTIAEIDSVTKAFQIYEIDTDTLLGDCRALACDDSNDPFLNALGVGGWKGPYIRGGIHNRTHAWNGHIGVETADYDTDGDIETFMILDDDPPGATPPDIGIIPNDSLLKIDIEIDDGDLSTGRFRSSVTGITTGPGSGVWLLRDPS